MFDVNEIIGLATRMGKLESALGYALASGTTIRFHKMSYDEGGKARITIQNSSGDTCCSQNVSDDQVVDEVLVNVIRCHVGHILFDGSHNAIL